MAIVACPSPKVKLKLCYCEVAPRADDPCRMIDKAAGHPSPANVTVIHHAMHFKYHIIYQIQEL